MVSSPPAASLLSTSLSTASSLVLLQLFSRVFTFGLNQALVRLVSPQVFGTAAIQFELLLSTILFLSREGVRNALLRAPSSSSKDATRGPKDAPALVNNISVLPVMLGVPTAVVSAILYVRASSYSTTSQPHFRISVAMYALAALLELLSEPLYIRAQNQLRFDLRVRAEGTAVVLKTVVSFIVLVSTPPEFALVAFSAGQVAYGLAVFLSYLRVYGPRDVLTVKKVEVTIHDNKKTMYFDPDLLHLSAAMTGQSVIKHFLTEGDKFLVSRLSPLADQGGYAIASNYGSLVARIVFQPIEETSRVFFSKTLSSTAVPTFEVLQTASSILLALLLLFTHLLLLLATFGPPYLPLAVSLLLPPRYHATSAPTILHTYIYYIPTMAFNGVLEAFFASTATPAALRAQARWMFVFSLGFVALAVGLARGLGLGDAGLVWANIANLWLRAAYAWIFVRAFFAEKKAAELVRWTKAVPPFAVLAVFAGAAAITRWSGMHMNGPITLRGQAGHVAIGGVCVVGCLLSCYIFERRTFQQVYTLLRKR